MRIRACPSVCVGGRAVGGGCSTLALGGTNLLFFLYFPLNPLAQNAHSKDNAGSATIKISAHNLSFPETVVINFGDSESRLRVHSHLTT